MLCYVRRCSLLHILPNLLYKIENREASKKADLTWSWFSTLCFSQAPTKQRTREEPWGVFLSARYHAARASNLTIPRAIIWFAWRAPEKFRFRTGSKTLVHDCKRCGIATVVGSGERKERTTTLYSDRNITMRKQSLLGNFVCHIVCATIQFIWHLHVIILTWIL